MLRGHPKTVCGNNLGIVITVCLRKGVCDRAPFMCMYSDYRADILSLDSLNHFLNIGLDSARGKCRRGWMVGDADFRSSSENGDDGWESSP